MLSNPQKALLKNAQRQAALPDADYREALAVVSGFDNLRSSTDQRLTDEHLDKLMAYFEAIYWRKVDAGQLQPLFSGHAPGARPFRQRGYWASKNQRGNTSRDRYHENAIATEIADLERQLMEYGCSLKYFQAIQNTMRQGGQPFSPVKYAAALKRTLEAKLAHAQPAVPDLDQPF
jgi:hypothetical protein